MTKKIKLTKLTVANLEHTTGGVRPPELLCQCAAWLDNFAYNMTYKTAATFCIPYPAC